MGKCGDLRGADTLAELLQQEAGVTLKHVKFGYALKPCGGHRKQTFGLDAEVQFLDIDL